MEIYKVRPFKYSGQLSIPYSKSYLQRAIAIAGLSERPTKIIGFTPSKDVLVALGIVQSLGGDYSIDGNTLIITPINSRLKSAEIKCGEAGLSTRMFGVIASAICDEVLIEGEGSILARPMHMLIEGLSKLGVETTSNNGCLPVQTKTKLRPGKIEIDGSESSQVLTGLLITLPLLNGNSEIKVKNLKSKPYVQMTLDILKDFGISITHRDYKTFSIRGNQKPQLSEYFVEGDWSGASVHVVGAAISGKILLKNLNPNSSQADKVILEAVIKAGGNIDIGEEGLTIEKNQLNAFDFDATECPDLFPALVALASCCSGVSTIKGVERLKHKESNRALTLKEEFNKLGIDIEYDEVYMRIKGGKITPREIASRNDHRIAMAAAIMATQCSDSITIQNPMTVNKSYPEFYDDINYIAESR